VTSSWLHVLCLASIPEDSTCLLFLLDFYIIGFLPSIWMMMMCGSKILSSSSELCWAYVCSKLKWQNKTNCTAYYLQLVFTSGFGALWRVFCWFWRAITNYIHPLFPLEFHDSDWFILNNDTVTLWIKLTHNLWELHHLFMPVLAAPNCVIKYITWLFKRSPVAVTLFNEYPLFPIPR